MKHGLPSPPRRVAVASIVSIVTTLAVAAVTVLAQGPFGRGAPAGAPMLVCGEDQTLVAPIPLRWETIVLAGDGRIYSPCAGQHGDRHREVLEALLLVDAARSDQPSWRRLAAQAHGRLGNPSAIALLLSPIAPAAGAFTATPRTAVTTGPRPVTAGPAQPATRPAALDDENATVRRTAANAIGDALSGESPEPSEPGNTWPAVPTADQMIIGRQALQARLVIEKDDYVAGTILETLGRLDYKDDATRAQIEFQLDTYATGTPPRILGAVKGLEALIRGKPSRKIDEPTRQKLREWSVIGPTLTEVPTLAGKGTAFKPGDEDRLARVRRLALLALQELDDDDTQILEKASHDADWQVRRLVAARLDLSKPEFATLHALLAVDPAFQVRFELAGAVARLAAQTHDCRGLLRMTNDPAPLVAVRAIDELPESCAEPAPVVARLTALTDELDDSASGQTWHVPTHAWIALARFNPARARQSLETAASHAKWPVRAAAASAAGVLRDDDTLVTLAADREPNVRTAALEALAQMRSPGLAAAAIRALANDDLQLILMAATVLKGTSGPEREEAVGALLGTFQRLTRKASDTSRETRVAILQRLQEFLGANGAPQLFAFRMDFDPAVRGAALAAVAALLGNTAPPAPNPQHRYPLQPTISQLQQLPTGAKIRIAGGGAIDLAFLLSEAPVTVARFADLVRSGYYNGLTFHRVVPNFLIQGGSPGANGYMGTTRYWRDEIDLEPHTRGAVGLSNHGRDTGDGQFFIDLVDQPRLDHEYTVFARVTAGLDVIDGIMEGTRIESITLK